MCCAIVIVLTSSLWLTALGSYLVNAGQPEHADLAVVLGGDGRGNRVLKAAELVKDGYVPQALVSGPLDCCYGLPESDLAIPFAVKHGYPESYFLGFPNHSLSTVAEARLIIPELRRRNIHSIDLVTSNYHTRRAGRIFRSFAPDLAIHVVAAPSNDFTTATWWKSREGQKIFAEEWAKTVANWFGI